MCLSCTPSLPHMDLDPYAEIKASALPYQALACMCMYHKRNVAAYFCLIIKKQYMFQRFLFFFHNVAMALEYFRNLDRVELEDDILRRERFHRDKSNPFTLYDKGGFLEIFRVFKVNNFVPISKFIIYIKLCYAKSIF